MTMIFRHSGLFCFAAAMLMLTGCAFTPSPASDPAPKRPALTSIDEGNEAEARRVAENFQKAFLNAYRSGHAELLQPFLPSGCTQTEPLLRQWQELEKTYGKVESVRFGCEAKKPLVRDYYWILRCVKKEKPPQPPQVTELFLMVRIGCQEGQCVVAGFKFRY